MARADRETWAKRVERWRESGLSAAEFAAEIGVTPKSLSWWKWQLGKARAAPATRRRRKTAKAAASPLTFVEMAAPLRGEPIEIVFPNDVRVRVPVGVDTTALTRVLEALGKAR